MAGLHLKPRGKANVRLKLAQLFNWCMRQKLDRDKMRLSEVKVKVPRATLKS